MPNFDLRGIKVAKYVNTAGDVTYTDVTSMGDAKDVKLDFKFSEGRCHAEGKLAEFIKEIVGGTISISVKYIPDDAQTVMYNARTKTITVNTKTVNGLAYGSNDTPGYVGVAFYAPDMIDGVKKFTCVCVRKALFGQPSMQYKTKDGSIEFNTPTTTGEFMPDDTADADLVWMGVAETATEAQAWITEVLK